MFERLFDQGVPGPMPPSTTSEEVSPPVQEAPQDTAGASTPAGEEATEDNPYPANLYDQGHDGPG